MRKFYAQADAAADLGPREIRVIANSGSADRVKDTMSAKGAKLDNYRKNPIVLADHDRKSPIGNFAPEVSGDALTGILTFAPAGISAKADEYCGLYKAGVMSTVSVGFNPIEYEPNKAGGFDFAQWELLELSCVAVPCDPGAVTIGRSLENPMGKSDGSWKVGASRNLPIGADEAWDGPAAEASIFSHCGFDGDKPDTSFARKGFLCYDAAAPAEKGSYKLPFARMVDGRLAAMPSGIRAAASRLPQADIPAEVEAKARAVIDHYEAKMKPSDDGKAAEIATLEAVIAELKSGKALSASEMEHVAALKKCMSALGACHMKALDSRGQTHAELEGFRHHLNEAGYHAKALGTLEPGVPAGAHHVDHVQALTKCVKAMGDRHLKALDCSSETEDHLKSCGAPLEAAEEHLETLAQSGRKPPQPADADAVDPDDDNDDDSDQELAASAARRERLIDIAARQA